jgi:O-methyltransferase domain/Dimerisation domain
VSRRPRVDPLELATAYQRSAVVAAACATGVADAIAAGPRPAEAVATACGTDQRATRALLGGLVALGLAEAGPGGYALSADGATLASRHPRSVARIVAKEWFFYQAWAGLPDSVGDGHARIPPWRQRLAADPGRSLDFLRALDDLATRFAGELPGLTGLQGPGRLLEVGGGAGSHAAALARAAPGLEATVLDLPAVEPVLRERHPELAFVAGDLDLPRFGRPADERWDAVLLANVLHDHPAVRGQAIVATAAGLLAPGGTLLVYEWVLDDAGGPPAVALFDLMMLVENEGGAAWAADRLIGWLGAAGLTGAELRRGAGPIAVVAARAPGPPDAPGA